VRIWQIDVRFYLSAAAAVAHPLSAPPRPTPLPAGSAVRAGGSTPQRPDRELRAILREIDAGRIGATVTRLAAFGTRHTLSSQTDPVRGIGAARDWIYEQLTGYAAASGGRMTVAKQTFIQPVSPRVPVPTPITNVIATLRGDTTIDLSRTPSSSACARSTRPDTAVPRRHHDRRPDTL
jgi:hypothetical protein